MTTKADTAAAAAKCDAAYKAFRRAIRDTVAAGDLEGMAIEVGQSKSKLKKLELATLAAEAHEVIAEKAYNDALAAYNRAMANEVAA
jgi:hypothetical protein